MPAATIIATHVSPRAGRRWDDLAAIALLIVLISTVYMARLSTQPIVGEESRWGAGAREMLATGDWIVPRQQGHVFPERPPMTMWAMAVAGWLRGAVDPITVRLPSVLAVLLTSLLIYFYARTLASQFAALIAAIVYATMGQVLQIGRLGESESLFALFVSASLMLWHVGYSRGWTKLATWCIGFACAALAALVKGPQAPVYFVSITAMYLALRREWRFLFCWQYAAAATVFATIIATWQIPFYLATDWSNVKATWSGLAADRFKFSGFAAHAISYPLETFACLLPWSPLLVALARRETRELLFEYHSITTFIYVAVLVAYPTVWMATGARGRYFMPLYPLIAVLIALVIERCSTARLGRYPRRAWHQFLLLCGALIGIGGAAIGVTGITADNKLSVLHQPQWFSFVFAGFASGVVVMLWKCYHRPHRFVPMIAVLTIATFVGAAYTSLVINVNTARWNNPAPAIAEVKQRLPLNARLVSFTPIEHRFAFYYGAPIPELGWPIQLNDVPPNVDYFCFMRSPGDTAESRAAGRGRTWTTTPGTLPFAWQELKSMNVERSSRDKRTVVIGRVIRPMRAEVSDATRPRVTTAQRSSVDKQN
jgi:4-amino-4-deoxy-L-arabinose transferase-like glycosyltransferase